MRSRRWPQLASASLAVVVIFAIVGVVWGASHDGSKPRAFGSAAQQTATRGVVARLPLPTGLAYDPTFTACGAPGDACATSAQDVDGTVSTLRTVFASAGGQLAPTCETNPLVKSGTPPALPVFTCGVEARLHGTWIAITLGGGWRLPGNPMPRTAVLLRVETKTGDIFTTAGPETAHAPLPAVPPDVTAFTPAGWTSTPQPCADQCSAHATTVAITAAGGVTDAAQAFASLALSKGLRIDGRPCITHAGYQGCQVAAERRLGGASGAVRSLVAATLVDDGHGHATGTISAIDES